VAKKFGIALALYGAILCGWLSLANGQTATVNPVPAPAESPMMGTSGAPSSSAPVDVPTQAAPDHVLPGGTTVVVSLTEPLSSATADVGDQIAIVVKKAVVIDGLLYIAEGANGHATVTSADHSAGNGSGGKLAIAMDWVYAADGGKVKLSQTNHASETGDTKGASSTATIATYLLLGPLGLFAHNFVHGKDVTISPKQTFIVFIDHDVPVVAKPFADPLSESTPR
jgi:hypothetical protein